MMVVLVSVIILIVLLLFAVSIYLEYQDRKITIALLKSIDRRLIEIKTDKVVIRLRDK
jgi:hypothetical protein